MEKRIFCKKPALRRVIFSKMNTLDNRAIALFKRGKIKEGEKLENKSDALYKKNYSKMFGIRKIRK